MGKAFGGATDNPCLELTGRLITFGRAVSSQLPAVRSGVVGDWNVEFVPLHKLDLEMIITSNSRSSFGSGAGGCDHRIRLGAADEPTFQSEPHDPLGQLGDCEG